MDNSFNPDLELDHQERGELGQLAAMPGYKVLHKIFRSEVDKFFVALANANSAKPEEVVTAQILYKSAAMFYQGVTNHINEEVMAYTHAPRSGAPPIDMTEGLLDLGEYANALEEEYE